MRSLLITVTTFAILAAAACRDGGSKEGDQTATTNGSQSRLGNPPASWTTGPPTGARKASYMVRDVGGAVADISLVVLPGSLGDLRETVNQWRNQLGAQPLDQTAFRKQSRTRSLPSGEAVVFDIIGMVDGSKTAFDGRMVAAVVSRPNKTWIFKMRGNAALVGIQKEAFLNWVASVEPDALEAATSTPAEPPPLPAPALHPPPGREPVWLLPEDWVAMPPTPPRFASFAVPGSESETGIVSVILLAGGGGGPLANVNRWRNQLGLPPIAQRELAATTQSIWSGDTQMTMIELSGPERGTIAAWTRSKDGTWLLQFTAPHPVIAARRPAFGRFLKSVRLPED